MSKLIGINWTSKQGRVELQKIAVALKLELPLTYDEQKSWAKAVVEFFNDKSTLITAPVNEYVYKLRGATDSLRKPTQAIGELPSFIPDLNEDKYTPSVDIKLFEIPNIKVIALFNIGFVFFDEQDRVLEEISSQYFPLLQLNPDLQNILASCRRVSQSATFIADWFFERNYAHWLLDSIPRLIDRVGKVVCHTPEKSWQQQLLTLYNVKHEDIVSIEPNVCISFSSLVLDGNNSRPVPHPSYKCHMDAIRFIKQPIDELEQTDSTERLALIIKRYDSRVLINSAELEDLLIKLGYVVQIIDCATIPVKVQIKCFATADVIFGVHGAAMANVVFCKPRAHVYEIFPPNYGNPAFWAVCNATGTKYSAITGVEELADANKLPRYRDIKLSTESLRELHNNLTS